MLLPSPPPLAAVWEVPARRFRRRVGALVIVRPTRGARGTVLAQQSGSFAILAAIRRASLSSERRKRTPSGETAWGPEVLQFRLWAEQRGCRGTGSRPVRLNSATQQVTPLPRQLRLCIARTICSYHSRFGRKSAILQGVLGRGEDHAPFSVVVVCRPRVVGPCLFWLECLGAEVRRPTVCAPLRNGLPVGKANSALHVRSWWLQVRVMLGS
jgi:hypothetical protein